MENSVTTPGVARETLPPLVVPRGEQPVIRLEKLGKNYYMGRNVVQALRGVSIEVARGDFVTIMGPSGSGKSTLMNLLGCLDRPTSGNYLLDGVPVSEMDTNELADIRTPCPTPQRSSCVALTTKDGGWMVGT